MSTILDKITLTKTSQLEKQKRLLPLAELESQKESFRKPNDFFQVFQNKNINIIAEIKYASPSEGMIYTPQEPVKVAKEYIDNRAAALSILTEEEYFKGNPIFLEKVRQHYPDIPILMKDFFVDEYQIATARKLGADAVLLIVALLGKKRTAELMTYATDWGLTPLVEVHDLSELEIALALKAPLTGVNNRSLKTLEVSLQTSRDLVKNVPDDVTLIAESGLSSYKQLSELHDLGYRGFLIGTSFMRSGNPGKALSDILHGGNSEG